MRSTSSQKPSLTRRTLFDMTWRVTGVMLVSVGISYFYLIRNLEDQTKVRLEQYITRRGQEESLSFLLIEQNHAILRQEFLERLKSTKNQDPQARFDQIIASKPDSTLRTLPELYSGKLESDGSVTRYINGVIFNQSLVNNNLRRQFLVAYDLLTSYAPVLRKELESIYFFIPDGSGVAYSPNVDWNLQASANGDFTKEEWAYAANIQNNPSRSTVWTGLYYEAISKEYLVTYLTPIDVPGYLPITLSSDLLVTKLLEQTLQDRLEGTYNIIFQSDGRLIAHPQLMSQLELNQGQLPIQKVKDAHLDRIFQLVKNSQPNQYVLDNSFDREYLAVTRIEGPNWYFVSVYPKSLLSTFAFKSIQFVLASGLIALIVEIGLLFSVLRQQIDKPLDQLIAATDSLSSGNFDIHLDTGRQDELGQLADSFNQMTHQLNHSFMELEKANSELEHRVEERTLELKNSFTELQLAQTHLVQSEKMSALGQMVAGVAHEINNPINFIHGNLTHLDEHIKALFRLIDAYQQECPNPPRSLQATLDETELDFLTQDLSKILQSMRVGTDRVCEIIKSLRNFSRLDEAEFKAVDIHEGIDNTLMILRHRLKATTERSEIKVIKDYGVLPLTKCFAGQLNQVFMNILSNAIDAIDDKSEDQNNQQNHSNILNSTHNHYHNHYKLSQSKTISDHFYPSIWIQTNVIQSERVIIQITDNGAGMSQTVQSRIFDPFFTTKPVGKGTGLGLSISYQIVTEKHGGKLLCESSPEQGTRFLIEMPIHQSPVSTPDQSCSV